MATPARIPRHRGVKEMLREFLEKVLDGEDEVQLGEVIAYARRRFANDEEFHQALLDDALGLLVADELRALMRNERRKLYPTESGYVRADRVEIRAKEIAARMFESVGDGRRKSLLAMTRRDLDYAIDARKQMISGLSRWNGFAGDLRRGLRNDQQTVGERYSDEQFERIWERHFERRDAGQLRLAATS